jgi:hypothetical protein
MRDAGLIVAVPKQGRSAGIGLALPRLAHVPETQSAFQKNARNVDASGALPD